jgi:hypothetical protein
MVYRINYGTQLERHTFLHCNAHKTVLFVSLLLSENAAKWQGHSCNANIAEMSRWTPEEILPSAGH